MSKLNLAASSNWTCAKKTQKTTQPFIFNSTTKERGKVREGEILSEGHRDQLGGGGGTQQSRGGEK